MKFFSIILGLTFNLNSRGDSPEQSYMEVIFVSHKIENMTDMLTDEWEEMKIQNSKHLCSMQDFQVIFTSLNDCTCNTSNEIMSLLNDTYGKVESRQLSYWHNAKRIELLIPVISCKFGSSTIHVAKRKNSPDYLLFSETPKIIPFAIGTKQLSIEEVKTIIKRTLLTHNTSLEPSQQLVLSCVWIYNYFVKERHQMFVFAEILDISQKYYEDSPSTYETIPTLKCHHKNLDNKNNDDEEQTFLIQYVTEDERDEMAILWRRKGLFFSSEFLNN